MGKRKAKGSPKSDSALTKIPKLLQPSCPLSNCVTTEIDCLMEEVESMLGKNEKNPRKGSRKGSLSPFLLVRRSSKSVTPANDEASLPLLSRVGSREANPLPSTPVPPSIKVHSPVGVITHDIPCTNLFFPLAIQYPVIEQRNPPTPLEPVMRNPPTLLKDLKASTQEELVSLVIDLKYEVRELKLLLAEVLNTLRLPNGRKDTTHTHENEVAISNARTPPFQGPEAANYAIGLCCPGRDAYVLEVHPAKLAHSSYRRGHSEAPFGHRSLMKLDWDSTFAYDPCGRPANGHAVYMSKVPPLPPNSHEDNLSLINKVFYWLSHTRQCGSIIYSDIISVERLSDNPGNWDSIKLVLASPSFVRGLLCMEARSSSRNGSNIYLNSIRPAPSPLAKIPLLISNPRALKGDSGSLAPTGATLRVNHVKEYDPSVDRPSPRKLDQIADTSIID
ncbi:hypothetical protein NDU88_004333 [Pleurodeles waltl]|uniref:Uncharacterized protein n=1 Tax=Pleurodeles waltl TaxID=8319 RepID=A0AAV7M9M2_PLEWA|nr:hypothetical protein NDU88_004333 [Pleurodeles waltl]